MGHTVPYLEQIVAFIDVLGFSRLLDSTNAHSEVPEVVWEIETAFKTIESKAGLEFAKDEVTARMFSDSICLAAPHSFRGFVLMLLKTARLQWEFLRNGLLVRGGISHGRHYESDTVIFSDGLLRAFRLENTVALDPRIVIDRNLIWRICQIKDISQSLFSICSSFLLMDSDNQVFLNYLAIAPSADVQLDLLRAQKKIVEDGRNNYDDPSILRKLSWLMRFHNSQIKVSQRKDRRYKRLMIDAMAVEGFKSIKLRASSKWKRTVFENNPNILDGETVFKGTRVPAAVFIDCIEANMSLDEFLREFPSVTRKQAISGLRVLLKQLHVPAETARHLVRAYRATDSKDGG